MRMASWINVTLIDAGTRAGSWRWPAEFEPHAATAFTWPHNPSTWHRGLDAPRRALVAALRALLRFEVVHLHVMSDAQANAARDLIGVNDNLTTHVIQSNDAWCRDHGAIIVRNDAGERAVLNFGYNAWGGKYPPWDLDAQVANSMAAYLNLPVREIGTVMEGGAIDGNGQGVVMTTASCVLNPNRNPSITKRDIDTIFSDHLGSHLIVWLAGEIPGDDTDGHIDNLARFVSPACALVVAPAATDNAWQRELAANPARVEEQCAARGLAMEVRTLPLPMKFVARTGLPASYANFLIANQVVLMPVYGDPADDRACAIVASCFPGRELIPIDCRELIVGLGALHCLSQQIPV